LRGFFSCAVLLGCTLQAQVYSPRVLKEGQPDTSDLAALARGIFNQAAARTPRDKAEAIWRFFLTDGRFVKPGMIYHIAGWAYEEPAGEVLDPLKLLNSYGFGLCYHIAPLLESVYKAGGFADARVWFLTGHTVAEVFYDGGYHYFDSDMMGYNPVIAPVPLKQRPVASVHQIEQDGSIITGKLAGREQVDVTAVDSPWYPADVREHAIGGLAELFTSSKDNWVYPYQRYQSGHTMDFVLRPGERIVRYFRPTPEGLYYLPYKFDGATWHEFPQEVEFYKIRTVDGPQSQKDARRWATGLQEYRPPISAAPTTIYRMPCPYVIIDASFSMTVTLLTAADRLVLETSVDDGRTWTAAATLTGPHEGHWTAAPAVLTKSEHGTRNAVSGAYGYLLRVNRNHAALQDLTLTTRFQLNPRTLPALTPGRNTMEYSSSSVERWELPAEPARMTNAAAIESDGQSYLANTADGTGEAVFEVKPPDGGYITGFDAGARFFDLRDGLAPDKFTAEIRKVPAWPAGGETLTASLSWSASIDGPFQNLWVYDPQLKWKDGDPIDRTLRWPEVDRQVRNLPPGTRSVFVKCRFHGLAMDTPRMAAVREGGHSIGPLTITHVWLENGKRRQRAERIGVAESRKSYEIEIAPGVDPLNEAVIFESYAAK
jgi:hypothetical protein